MTNTASRLAIRGDDGAGSVLMVFVAAVIAVIGAVAIAVTVGIADRQRAQTAADVAALSAAHVISTNPTGACHLAADLVHQHHAELQRCTIDGDEVVVVTTIEGRGLVRPSVHGVARAGQRALD